MTVRVTGRSWLLTNLRAVRGRAYVRVVGSNREPSWFLSETAMPVLAIAAYVFVYRSLGAPEEYVGFALLGGAMTAFWLNVLWSMAGQFFWEQETGNMDLFLVAPISRMSILLGMALGGLFGTTLRATSVLIVGSVVFHVRFAPADPLLIVTVFLITMTALYGMGVMFASFFFFARGGEEKLVSMFQEPVYLVSGFYYPVRNLGPSVAAAASFIPMTLGMDALRQLLFRSAPGTGLLPVPTEIGLLALLAVGFCSASVLALRTMERVAKRSGRLALRWN